MNKIENEKNAETSTVVEPKRSEEAFKRQAVEHWLRSGKKGTQIAKELGMSCPESERMEASLRRGSCAAAGGSGSGKARTAGRTGAGARTA